MSDRPPVTRFATYCHDRSAILVQATGSTEAGSFTVPVTVPRDVGETLADLSNTNWRGMPNHDPESVTAWFG